MSSRASRRGPTASAPRSHAADHEELGEQDDNAEIDELRKKIEDSKMNDEAPRSQKQLSRMSQIARRNAQHNTRTYVENLLEIVERVH